jgi:phage tail-like protein
MKSSYVRYLPPVLWESPKHTKTPGTDDDPQEFSLTTVLCIFEKMLTGIDDNVTLDHAEHTHEPITATVDRLPQLYDPWRVPADPVNPQRDFLAWLASWVGLEFPSMRDELSWDEYQRRKATAEIARVHRSRGLRSGLGQYLGLFNVSAARPRIAIYDGNKLQAITPTPSRLASVTGVPYPTPSIVFRQAASPDSPDTPQLDVEGLVSPQCIAGGSNGDIFVGDAGISPELVAGRIPNVPSRLWRIQRSGSSPGQAIVAPDGFPAQGAQKQPFTGITAVAVRPAQNGTAEALYFIDMRSEGPTLGRLVAPYTGATAEKLKMPGQTLVFPVALSIDDNGELLILDRGEKPGETSDPKLIALAPDGTNPRTRPLKPAVIEPLSMLVVPGQPRSTIIIGDGRAPDSTSANLVRLDRGSPPAPDSDVLPKANPIVAPVGLVGTNGTDLFVLDGGLRPFRPPKVDPFMLTAAEPAVIRLIDLSQTPPTSLAITAPGNFVYPTGMAASGDQLVVCDPGPLESPGATSAFPHRVLPHEFGISVHFARDRLPPGDADRASIRGQILGDIHSILVQQQPAHTRGTVISS